MQYGPKTMSHFSSIGLDKSNNKKINQWEFFNSIFSFGKLRARDTNSFYKHWKVFWIREIKKKIKI